MDLHVFQLCDLINEIGEEITKKFLADFSCPINQDIESFIKEKAILFEKMDKSRTYIILGINETDIAPVAYFTLANRPITLEDTIGRQKKETIFRNNF